MQPIDRKALVARHNPVLRRAEPISPLSVGNGELACTVDITGMQSFPEAYDFPLGTMSHWGWHCTGGRGRYRLEELRLKPFDTYGRSVGYATDAAGQEEAFHWLRQNPHRVQLGTFGLEMKSVSGGTVGLSELQDIEQTLDLWRGVITSRFKVEGTPVTVVTACRPDADELGFRIESPLIGQGRLAVTVRFPAPHPQSRSWGSSMNINWEDKDRHATEVLKSTLHEAEFRRTMDEDAYDAKLVWTEGELRLEEEHRYRIIPSASLDRFELSVALGAEAELPPNASAGRIFEDSALHWERFWLSGGAVELADSRDPRGYELERRVVLSQFLTALHSAGKLPPQETGLAYNSWFGKPHLEMHWWHAAHFAQWGRIDLLRRSMDWYGGILPKAKALAESQGYEGARWPKMVGPEGDQSPSNVATLLIWQQPHPIDMAELIYQAEPMSDTLERYRDVVLESARFMASFSHWDEAGGRYVLGPPVIPAQENHKGDLTMNPVFELEYWHHGLAIANAWRRRLGLPTEPEWERVCERLSRPRPVAGVYEAHENLTDTYTQANVDHPSMLGACGILPGRLIDKDVMRRTLHRVLEAWQWETAWGWDFPMAAMTAARLGERGTAVDLLLMEQTKNVYLPNGHNYQRDNLLCYLPGNGGLLAAVALMAAGWKGGPETPAPGFPDDGTWTVRSEGLVRRL